jgi:outer membrane receptor protein involved in Fe transport
MRPVWIEELPAGAELELTVEPLASDAIVVSGSAPGIESTPAAGTTTIAASEIAARQPSNLVQALENVAGVSQVSEGQAAVPAVRGLFAGRTLILVDGARVTSERRVGPSATFLDPEMFDSVEVSRGPGSVAYGSDAFGGVISVRTRRVEPGSPWRGRLAASLGDGGLPQRSVSAEVSKGLRRGGILLAAHARDADDWESPVGPVLNSGYQDHGFLARGEHQAGRGILTAAWQADFGEDIERPRDNSATVRFFYPNEDSHRFTASYLERDVAGFSRLAVDGFFGTYDQTTEQDRFATATTGRSIERAVIEADDFQLRLSVERLLGNARLDGGLDLNGRQDLHALEQRVAYDLEGTQALDLTAVAIEDADRLDTGIYLSVDAGLSKRWSVASGVRGDRVTTDNTGGFFGDQTTSNTAASGFVALTAGSFGGFGATAQLARGFRDPTLSDRYYRGPTGRGFVTGNPDLDPETSAQLDLALRYTAARLRIAGFYYDYRIDDLIERYETAPDFFLFRNRGEARLRGFELEAQSDLGHGLALELAAHVAAGKALDDDGGDGDLDGIAPPTVSAQLRWQLARRSSAQLRVAHYTDDHEPGPTEREVPGYTLVDVAASYRFTRGFELRALARNLLDDEYFASQDTRAVLAPGRSIALSATFGF